MGGEKVIIFLDKDPARAALQYQRMKPEDQNRTVWIRTAREVISVIKEYQGNIDIISLGYDLTDLEYNHPGRTDCGLEVVRFLEKENPKDYEDVRFIIHSWNYDGSKKMACRLMSAGYNVLKHPFGS